MQWPPGTSVPKFIKITNVIKLLFFLRSSKTNVIIFSGSYDKIRAQVRLEIATIVHRHFNSITHMVTIRWDILGPLSYLHVILTSLIHEQRPKIAKETPNLKCRSHASVRFVTEITRRNACKTIKKVLFNCNHIMDIKYTWLGHKPICQVRSDLLTYLFFLIKFQVL